MMSHLSVVAGCAERDAEHRFQRSVNSRLRRLSPPAELGPNLRATAP